MFDLEAYRALVNGVVHVAGLCVHKSGGAALHPLCDPKVRWGPTCRTQRKTVTCLDCVTTEWWLDAHMDGMPLHEYFELHQAREVIRRPDATKKTTE